MRSLAPSVRFGELTHRTPDRSRHTSAGNRARAYLLRVENFHVRSVAASRLSPSSTTVLPILTA
jgi:hypothetical protein